MKFNLHAALVFAASIAGCSDATEADHHATSEQVGVATNSTCPPTSTLTYDSSSLSGAARNDAPEG